MEVVKDGKAASRLQGAPDKARFFGERALLKNEPRAASIRVVSTSARTLTVDKQSFELLLGPLEELKKRGKSGLGSKLQELFGVELRCLRKEGGAATQIDRSRFGKIKFKALRVALSGPYCVAMQDLKVLGLLGCGGFGAVELVEHQQQETYALKALSKGFVVKSGMQQSVISRSTHFFWLSSEVRRTCSSCVTLASSSSSLRPTIARAQELASSLEARQGAALLAVGASPGW